MMLEGKMPMDIRSISQEDEPAGTV